MKCCPVALYFMTEPGGVSQDMAVSPDGEPAADNGQSQVQSESQEDQASTEGLQKKPKAAPKKNSSSSIKLSDWVTSTTKIKVRWDQIIIDHDRKFGQVRRISDDRVQRRYDDLKAAPPVDWSNRGLYSSKSTDLAEISASLCVVQLMHNRSPPCATTCLQLHLVLSRWPKGSALLHHT